jgi:Mrp family chromosome partitioning ATPase
MARFLKAMRDAENGHRPPPAGDVPSLTVVNPPAIDAEPADDEPSMPFIEVGPNRSIEASADVLAYRPVAAPRAAAATPAAAAPDGLRAVTFRPLSLAKTATGIAPEVVAFHNPGHAIAGQYRDLLAAILAAATARGTPTLFFTGSAAGAGTTTVCLNVAVTAARQGRRVVVVDANPRRPAVAARLALCDRPGMGEVLAGTATLDEALQETEQPGLTALTGGGTAGNAPRAAETYRSLLRQLRLRFDLVLVDGPHWDGRPEVTAPGAACDAAFLVFPASGDDASATEELTRQLPASGVRLAGCVVAAR